MINHCKECKHFQFVREVQMYSNSPTTTCGKCLLGDAKHGNLTFAVSTACEDFEAYELKHKEWDSFLGKNGVITIERITPEHYPRVYRVSTSHHGGYSISEEELKEFKKIYTEPEPDALDKED